MVLSLKPINLAYFLDDIPVHVINEEVLLFCNYPCTYRKNVTLKTPLILSLCAVNQRRPSTLLTL